MKSIIQTEKKCFLTGRTDNLQDHHIFFGAKNRENSEKYGLKVWLTAEHHTGKHSPHRDLEIDLYLKRIAQRKFEETHSREEFMRIFGRNYL